MQLKYDRKRGVWHTDPPDRKWLSHHLNAGWQMPMFAMTCQEKFRPFIGKLCTDKPAVAAQLIWAMGSEGKDAYQESTELPEEYAGRAVPSPEGLEYMPHQLAAIQAFKTNNRMLLADEMGVGKTPTALGIINSNRRYRKVLVFCPASLKLNWLKEAYRWLVRDFIYHICGGEPPPGATFVICNYARAHSIFTWAMQKRFDLIICDEAHKLKNPRARRTKMVLNTRNQYGPREGICSRSKKVLLLTGTPIVNRPAELFPLIHTLNPGLFPSRTEFVKRYCPGKYMLGDVENLQLLLRSVMVRRLKKDVLKDLPDKTRRLVVVQPSSAVRSAMAEEHEAFEKVFGDPDDYEVMVQALNSPPCIGGLAGLSKARVLLAEAKIPDAIEYINMVLEETDKLIVFGHHKVLLGALIAHYGEEAVHITGSTSQKRRQQAVESFMEDENIKIFLGNIQAAGVGLTLTAASRVIMLELPWDPASVTQAEDRAHRHGQKDNVLVDHFLYDGSIDGRMAELIMKKQALIEATLGDDKCIDED